MIAEKTVQITSDRPTRTGDTDTDRPSMAVQTPETSPSEAEWLESLAADIRRDAKDQALFYLVRSNTGYDGE